MDLRQLESFDEVARQGSLSAAAQRLGYTQSAVSRHIAALEREMRLPLLQRQARGVRLTRAGEALLRHARHILDGVTTATEQLAALRRLDTGELRLGGVPTANVTLLPQAMTELRHAAAGLDLTVTEGTSEGLLDALHRGSLDVAVVTDYHPLPQTGSGDVEVIALLDDPLLLAMPSSHRFADRRQIPLVELADDVWVEDYPQAAEVLLAACERSGFTARIGVRCGGWMGKQGFVAAGHGIALIPGLAATGTRSDLVIRELHRDDAPVRKVAVAVTAQGRDPAVTAVLECIERATARHQHQLSRLLARTCPA
ncbi:LysR family transcriptional regulator [Spirillospora sp. CA-294931]|uniref:LysR family transcriptional regulator n=1 Tax=Spirillospora sp. CA-294931 TaxID=3240042 RepID=UPI003D9191C3